MPKRRISDSKNTDSNEANDNVATAPPQPGVPVDSLVKRLRALEAENEQLKARVVASENTVQQLAVHLTSSERAQPRTRPSSSFRASRRRNFRTRKSRPTLARGVVRQHVNSLRQFYVTLLAMYCSAFAHVMHGPDSAQPILSRADKAQKKNTTGQTSTDTSNSSSHFIAHGTASAGADMASQKYERMLRASSQGLMRLIQFRRKIVRERSRRAALVGTPQHKFGNTLTQNPNSDNWQ